MQPDFFERHGKKIEKSGDCWIWTGFRDKDGYGLVTIAKAPRRTHRVSYEVSFGPIPEGMCVLHRCDNPSCLLPEHLFLGSQADNVRDRHEKGRTARGVRTRIAVMDEERVRRLRAMRACGASLNVLATTFSISQAAAYQIITRRTWRHVA